MDRYVGLRSVGEGYNENQVSYYANKLGVHEQIVRDAFEFRDDAVRLKHSLDRSFPNIEDFGPYFSEVDRVSSEIRKIDNKGIGLLDFIGVIFGGLF